MFRWIPTISHVWPGIHPLNVWEMTYSMWLLFVSRAEAWEKQQKEQSKKSKASRKPGGRRRR